MHNVRVNRDALIQELRALLRGRGVRRSDLRDALGPELTHVAAITPDMSADAVRTALISALSDPLEKFPRDLRLLYEAATGIADDSPLLEERLLSLYDKLHRGPRVLRRRLRQAEQLLADALIQAHGVPDSDRDAGGWQWVTQDLSLVLGEGAQLDMRRTLLALDDHQRFVSESAYVTDIRDGDSVEVEVVSGAELVAVDDSTRGRWTFTLQTPHELQRGQELETHIRITLSRARALSPYLMLAPVRPIRAASMRVDLGTPLVGEQPWLVDGVFAAALALPDPARVELPLDETHCVTGVFTKLQAGHAYGIGWHWVN